MSYSGGGQRDAFTNVATKVYKTKKKGVNAKRKRVPRNQTTLFGVIEALMGHPIAAGPPLLLLGTNVTVRS